ncbi:hypothetical protein S4054249_23440 [Pseudoalteromonas luteoviolacea]|uniref:Iron uptake protein n=1 Tax=Pseudoalteromonas luteoviolacea S4054 TaxID=1129367 RepID=A0A0F6A9N9_9GAMM|nr:hypothetical protein S4054249_23440 [Pseudoalteromonas luteoviolacea]AOT20627.1 hypothetical protein S4054_23360 [Pseudoalteromonas luteoviolacea]KKE82848.1 hypothetical protein N479_16380 [Pseudoalteromonas luteoviolacea S4054]
MSHADNALTFQYRLSVASRFCAAILGGYFFTAYCISLLSLLLPTSRVDAVLYSVCASILIYSCVFIAVFAARSLLKVWVALVISTGVIALFTSYIQGSI